MTSPSPKNKRCAIYTRKSSEEGLEQTFNSLDAQREACESYIKSQQHEGWRPLSTKYDDGGFSGGNTERPGLQQLLDDIKSGKVDVIVVYKVDRLSRSLADFVRLIDLFDEYQVSFVSVTQQFNTSSSMGRLTLNVLLSFAQFEREVTGERIRDKIAASKQKGMWMGGVVPLGYDVIDRTLVVNAEEAKQICHIYKRYIVLGCVRQLKEELDVEGYVSKVRPHEGVHAGGKSFARGALYALLKNPLYIGKVPHQGKLYDGQHAAIVEISLWEKVQDTLKENRNNHSGRKSIKDPSLLAGLLFDENGNPMSPTHTQKENRRYRYYINQTVLQYREKDAGSILRLSAKIIENLVTEQLISLWKNNSGLLKFFNKTTFSATQQAALVQRAQSLADEWPTLIPHRKIDYLKLIFQKICVSCNSVDLHIFPEGMLKCLTKTAQTAETLESGNAIEVISIPAKLKRCGIETQLVINDHSEQGPHQLTVAGLQSTLLRALRWYEELLSEAVASTYELSRREKLDQRYIAFTLKLAFLAPDIMEAIIHGNIPAELTVARLKAGFPMDWNLQRKAFGFAS